MSASATTSPPSSTVASRWRGWILPSVILLLLVGLGVFRAMNASVNSARPYDFESLAPTGLRALRHSLTEMGYNIVDHRGGKFVAPSDGDLFVTWPGAERWSTQEASAMRGWAGAGRTVAVVANAMEYQYAWDDWGAEAFPMYDFYSGDEIRQNQPLLPDAPATLSSDYPGITFDFGGRIVPVTIVGDSGWRATAGVETVGTGAIWYLTDAHDLTNLNLSNPNQSALLVALLRLVPEGGTIIFDAYHLYGPELPEGEKSPAQSIQDWLYREPLGQALFFALIVGVVGWVLAGRRLGPPLKSARELKRREGAEYVRALAGLKRRAHAGEEIAARQRLRLKSALGKPRHIAAALDDAAFVAALRTAGDLNSDTIEIVDALLRQLHAAKDEKSLVIAAASVDEFLASPTYP